MMRRNAMTLLGAALLASGIFYVVNNPNLFMSSILSLQEQQFIKEKGRDVAYKTNDGYVDIFMSDHVGSPTSIDLTIIFDADSITIHPEQLSGQGKRTFHSRDKESIQIKSIPGTTINTDESLIMLPFSGDMRDILLGEALAKYPDKKQEYLSIGSLNELYRHSE